MRASLTSLLYIFVFALVCNARSFYDNPEQDQPNDSKEDLLKKWDFDVFILQFCIPIFRHLTSCSGDSRAFPRLLT
jgi:hypothetical protein